ncbi:LuxR C-terminal-related transcriptional regulator [Paraburkholderia acidiphila]|uniref:Helix-turn-helix transcriptional regulator n=1 Tax=Paraburkholderia acidiphila TaxID=2571747 RepID=A0A7Z2G4M1_9BURK|nr:LuxR C-terminal-related transcriptional regulator [Paraburkholderia acidiphila]QGZ55143.1 helix-turn-helix transcriptional regulator [Paraburkholderia acidiphila]
MPQRRPDSPSAATGAPSRVMAPRNKTRVVARERVVSQLIEARRKRCIVLQGPAGCGKTTTLLAWREALLPLGFDLAWLTLAPEDDDLASFIDGLVASLAQVDPAICREAAILGGRGVDDEAVERTVIALVRAIASRSTDLALVVDDLDHVTNPRSHRAFQWLIDYAPSNLHIVLVSRGSFPVSLGRLRDRDLVLELNMRDLRFTFAESAQYLRAQIGEVSEQDAREMHELTDGWVAGLQLFSMHLKRRRTTDVVAPLASMQLHDASAFGDYFERAVLSRLSATEIELLVRTSVCARLCSSLCVALVGDEQPPEDVLALLARLEADNLFIAQVERVGNETWYRLNPLFRETLLDRMRTRSEALQHAVHHAAWCWFRDHGLPEEAVRHALQAGEAAAAAELVLSVARDLQLSGDLRKLVSLIHLLPHAEIEARIDLRLWRLQLELYARDFEACAESMARLEASIPAEDIQARYRLLLLRAAVDVQRDDADSATAILPAILAAPVDATSQSIGARSNLLSWLYMRRGEYEEARAAQRDTPRPLHAGSPLMGTSAGVLNGRCLVGFSYALEGQFLQVERISREVLAEADERGSSTAEAACFAAALLGEALYEFNDITGARRLLEDRVDVLERVSIPDSVLRVHTALSAAHWAEGHRLDAFAYLERLEEYATRHGLPRLLAHSLAAQVRQHVHCGQFEDAEADLARLDTIAARLRPTRPNAWHDVHALAERSHVDWCLAHEDFEGAALRLPNLISHCSERGWQHHIVQLRMQSALVDRRRARLEAAREAALTGLRLANRLGLVRSVLDVDAGIVAFAEQVVHGMESQTHGTDTGADPVLAFYVDRLRTAQESAVALASTTNGASLQRDATPNGAETLSERETKVVSLLAQALPNKKIARTLGISPETVKWHLKNIYGKLGVSSRDEAVARVRDLGIDP